MAKSSIDAYRPVGLAKALDRDHRYVSDACLASLIKIAGELPGEPVGVQKTGDDGLFYFTEVEAREALQIYAESAATTYHVVRELLSRPTATQAAIEYERIETAARKLLITLRVGSPADPDNMPPLLREYGLLPYANQEADELEAARPGRRDGMVHLHFGSSLMRSAIKGIAGIEKWAAAARAAAQQKVNYEWAGTRPPRGRRAPRESNRAMDEFVSCVVDDCWKVVFGRQVADGPALIKFIRAAALGIGVKLSADAARERLRKHLGRR